MKYIIAVLFALSLSACGGGSGGASEPGPDPDPRPIPPDPPSADYHVYAPETPKAGERVAIAVYSDRKTIDSIVWSQATGSSVSILSETRKLISFVLPEAGFYSFTAELAFTDGSSSTEIIELNAETESRDQLDLVSDKVVLMGQTLTVRAQSMSGKPLLNPQWEQTSGPEVDVEYSSDSLKFATPAVSKDTLFTFTLTADTSTDQDLQDSVTVLVEPAVAFNSQSAWFKNRVTTTSAFNTSSEYANILANCVYSNSLTSSTNCSFQTLPLLAQQSSTITIADVMDRVVVSHQWMGEEFRNFLEYIDFHTDFSNLFGSVTAIVIADDINQSFFSSSTGAIYIDPHLLGLTPEQRATIVQQVDIRTTYGSGLQFGIYSRYTKDNQRVAQRISETSQDQYSVEDISYALQRLLYHELAHANDYFPADMIGSFAFNESPLSVAQNRRNKIELSSDLLVSTFPLANSYMKSLADVSFGNDQGQAVEPNSYQKSLTKEDVALAYQQDGANAYYSYTNSREDFAMLFEELMMQLRHGVKRDTAVADKESPYYIAWGQRGRISDTAVKSRAQLVFSKIRPDLDTEIQIAFLEPVTELQAGSAWFDTIEQDAQKIQAFSRSTTTSEHISEPVIGHPHPLNVPE